ncbi:MAG: hypothetical protein MJ245_06215 [Clostridia bacterium]|nr:hypothetical protein [Clostridia bacterium]
MVNLLTRLMMALQCSDYPEFQLVFASQVTTDQLMQFDTVISLCDLTKDDDTIATALTNFATIAKDQEISKKFFNVFLYDYYETTINPTSDNILIERFEKDFTYESLYINKSTKVDEEFLKVIARAGNDFRSYGYVREEVFDQIEASPLK